MTSNLFVAMRYMDEHRISYTVTRSGIYLYLTATLVGKRVEITVDEDDLINVAVFRGDETVDVGIDAVMKALEEDE